MNKQKQNLKALVLSLGLGAAMLAAPSVQAQGVFGDMLDNYYSEKESSSNAGALLRGNGDREIGIEGFTLGGAEAENPTPLGGGILVLVAAGAGYVALKKKEDRQ